MALGSILQEDLQCLRTLVLKGPQDTRGFMGEWAGLECGGTHGVAARKRPENKAEGSLVSDAVS